jgi:putative phage-type endonuclease
MSLKHHNAEWHEWRRLGIGGSDAPVIMNGEHFKKTPAMLWEEKCLGIYKEQDNYAMQMGRAKEEEGRVAFKELTGIEVTKKDYVVHPEISWLRCNLDGIDASGEVILEIKNVGVDDHIEALEGKVPHKYRPQVEHQRLVLPNVKEVHYISLNKDFPAAHIVVKPDKEYSKELFQKEQEFWDHVLKGIPPELTDLDYVDMSAVGRYGDSVKELETIVEQIKALEERKEKSLETLKSLSQGRSSKGFGFKLRKQIVQGAVDYQKAIRDYISLLSAKYPEIVPPEFVTKPYRKKSFEKWTPMYNQG